jgi:hypothetical protein
MVLAALPLIPEGRPPRAAETEPGAAPAAEDAPPGAGAAAPEAAPPDSGAPGPELLADFTARTYAIKPKKLWKALLPALETGGYPPEEVDDERMAVKTGFVDFEQKSFPEQVAEPPPRFKADYRIITMKRVVEGKVSLEAVVSKARGGAELKIRARILVQGLDRSKGIMILTDRRSSGVIEAEFLRRLEDDLDLERI